MFWPCSGKRFRKGIPVLENLNPTYAWGHCFSLIREPLGYWSDMEVPLPAFRIAAACNSNMYFWAVESLRSGLFFGLAFHSSVHTWIFYSLGPHQWILHYTDFELGIELGFSENQAQHERTGKSVSSLRKSLKCWIINRNCQLELRRSDKIVRPAAGQHVECRKIPVKGKEALSIHLQHQGDEMGGGGGEATPRSPHDSFEAEPGVWTGMST